MDAVHEEREVATQSGGTALERQRVCYAVWEDERRIAGKDLPAAGDARFEFQLPVAGTFADPVGDHEERYWEMEVTRGGGAGPLRFRVLVYPPAA